MAQITHTFLRNFSRPGESIATTVPVSADAEDCRNIAVPTGPSLVDYEVDLTVTVANLKSVYMLSDQPLTLHANTDGGQLIALAAGQPLEWTYLDGSTNPLGASNITKFLIANGTSSAASLIIRVLADSTPA